MKEKENIIIQRTLSNILVSMIKLQDAPCSSEMHLIESVVSLSKLLKINEFNDKEIQEQFNYCELFMLFFF